MVVARPGAAAANNINTRDKNRLVLLFNISTKSPSDWAHLSPTHLGIWFENFHHARESVRYCSSFQNNRRDGTTPERSLRRHGTFASHQSPSPRDAKSAARAPETLVPR